MHVIYKPERPEDGDRQEWEFVPGRVRASQAEMIENHFGGTWDEFRARLFQGSMKAQRVMLWHLFNLTHPGFRFQNVPDFLSDELEVTYSVSELTKLREVFEQANLPADAREAMLAELDKAMTAAMEREGVLGDPGKAPSNESSTDGGSPSQST